MWRECDTRKEKYTHLYEHNNYMLRINGTNRQIISSKSSRATNNAQSAQHWKVAEEMLERILSETSELDG